VIRLGALHTEVRAAAWFANLGEPPTAVNKTDAQAYAGSDSIELAHSWRAAEEFLKSADTSLDWWEREEALRKELMARARARYPEHELWTSLTELTTETGDLVHAAAAIAAARLGGAQPASIHVAAGAASQAVYQLAVARIAGIEKSPFESKFRLFSAGHWPLGMTGSSLVLF
jgi:hypothetical protein